MCNGSQKTSSKSTYTPTYQGYDETIDQAKDVASTPFNYNTTQDVAGFSPQQIDAFNRIGQMQGMYAPYINAGAQYTAAGAAPISGAAIQGYMDPYRQEVVDATMANINRNNAIQQNQLVGNAASQNALGGNRIGVMQGELARGQGMNSNKTIADLMSGGYAQALAAAQGDAGRQLSAGSQMAGFGQAAQNAELQGLQALLGAGNQQQQQLQNQYNAASGNYQAATMWPYQNTQWLAALEAALGPLMGGTTTGTSTTKQSMGLGQMLGAGAALLGAFADGGEVPFGSFANGSSFPWAQLSAAKPIIPDLPSAPQQSQGDSFDPKKSFELGKSARSGVDKILRGLDPVKGWGAEIVPTATMGASGGGGGLLSGLGSFFGFADGGRPELPQTPMLDAPRPAGGFAPSSYFSEGDARLAASRRAPAAAPATTVSIAPSSGNSGKGTKGGLSGGISSLFGNMTHGGTGATTPDDILSSLGGFFGGSRGFADGGGIFDEGFDLGALAEFAAMPEIQQQLSVTGSTPAAPPLSAFSTPDLQPALPEKRMPTKAADIAPPNDFDKYGRAIASLESGGSRNPYELIGPADRRGDKPYGKYQVMGANVGPWTTEIIGRRMTPQEFLGSPEAQEAVFKGKFGQYLEKTGSAQDAASMWHSGVPLARAQSRRDVLGTRTPDYVARFASALGDGSTAIATNARRSVAEGRDGPSAGSGLVQKGMDPEQPAAKRYASTEDKQAGGLLQRLFGIEFNPLRLDKDERMALMTAGLAMMSNGNIGQGGLAGLQYLAGADQRRADAADRAQKLMFDMMKERKLTEIGKDPLTGDPLMGWADPFTQRVTPVSAAGGMGGGAPVPGSSPLSVPAAAPQASAAPPSSPSSPAPMVTERSAPSAQAPISGIPAGYREEMINPARLRKAAEGYIYELGPNGGVLLDANNVPKQILQKEAEAKSKLAGSQPEDAFRLQESIAVLDEAFRRANEVANHPGLSSISGLPFSGEVGIKGVGVDIADIAPGSKTADAFNKHKTLLSNVVLGTMQQLKAQSSQGATGFGALSEKELEVLMNSAGNLKLSSSEGELRKNYADFQKKLMDSRERQIARYKEKYGAEPKGIPSRQQLIDNSTASALESAQNPGEDPWYDTNWLTKKYW